jgi:hypothetical protein
MLFLDKENVKSTIHEKLYKHCHDFSPAYYSVIECIVDSERITKPGFDKVIIYPDNTIAGHVKNDDWYKITTEDEFGNDIDYTYQQFMDDFFEFCDYTNVLAKERFFLLENIKDCYRFSLPKKA